MFSPLELTIAWVVTFVAAILQGTVGFGFAVLSVPILTLVDPAFTPIPQLFLALPMTVAAAWRERSQLDLSGLGWIVIGRIPGALAGAWVLTVAAERTLAVLIGVMVLGATALNAYGIVVRLNPATRMAAGLASGFSGTTSAIGGPPLALLYQETAGATVRSSLGAVFTVGLMINISSLFATGAVQRSDATTALWLAVPLAAGFALSGRLKHLMEGQRVRRGILVVSAAAALGLLIRTLVG